MIFRIEFLLLSVLKFLFCFYFTIKKMPTPDFAGKLSTVLQSDTKRAFLSRKMIYKNYGTVSAGVVVISSVTDASDADSDWTSSLEEVSADDSVGSGDGGAEGASTGIGKGSGDDAFPPLESSKSFRMSSLFKHWSSTQIFSLA
jgi:hypothetical protein